MEGVAVGGKKRATVTVAASVCFLPVLGKAGDRKLQSFPRPKFTLKVQLIFILSQYHIHILTHNF